MTTEDKIKISAILCQGGCDISKHPNLLVALLEANNSCQYITEWTVRHLAECDGPMIANLIGGGSSIYMPNRNPKVVFPGCQEEWT